MDFLKHSLTLAYARLLDWVRGVMRVSDATMKLKFIPGFHRLRCFNAQAKAYAEFIRAYRTVPAYRHFMHERGFRRPTFSGLVPNIAEIPATDKESYVLKYGMEERCRGGRFPREEVVIDESSGSSGQPVNWARGKRERRLNGQMIRMGMRLLVGSNEPLFVINAFALGPWATGVNVTMSCVRFARIKSLGPDARKIENTLLHFGTAHQYVIMGYPPFLKQLVDDSAIDWHAYNIIFIFGGEPMTEGLRDYLYSKGIRKVFSSLGASDLELNLAAENEFTVALRRLMRANAAVRARLQAYPGALPMIFQYNPADFYMECTEEGELIVTICRSGYLAPKIRYNLHDRASFLSVKDLYAALAGLSIPKHSLPQPPTDMPLLLHYGRSDATVSFFGANIGSSDVQEALYALSDLAPLVNSFCIRVTEDKEGAKHLAIAIELCKGRAVAGAAVAGYESAFFDSLAAINQDFREARRMVRRPEQMALSFHEAGSGGFEQNDIRIKMQYIR